MKKANSKQVRLLMYEVINNAIQAFIAQEKIPFLKIEDVKRIKSEPLAVAYKKFVVPSAKTVKVYIEREYNRKKREYVNTIYVLVDNIPELFTPSIFVDCVVGSI